MSLRNLTSINNTKIFCGDFDCKNMTCENMNMPAGADLDAHNVSIDNDLLVKTQDGLNTIKYNTPNIGNAGDQLTIDALGNAYWANSAGPSGVSNPMSNDLDINNFDLLNVEKLENLNAPVGSEAQITLSTPNGITRLEGLELEMAYGFTDYLNGDIKNLGSLTVKGISLNTASPAPSSIEFLNDIDLKNNEIKNVGLLNNCILVRSEADLPNPITTGNYLIMDNITLTQSYTVNDNVSFFGLGREGKSSLNFLNTDPFPNFCLQIIDASVSFNNLTITNQSSVYDLMNCVNNTKDKILTFSNCAITDCKNANVVLISGFDLVDLNQCLFQYNYPSGSHFRHTNGSKLQISSCEFLRQLERGSSPFNYGTADMINLVGSFGAINISSNLIHPRNTQNGINIDPTLTSLNALIGSNTFISVGLTTGRLIDYNTSINQYPFLIISDNTGVRNEKALLEGQSIGNTTYTATTAGVWTPVDFGAGFTVPVINRFEPTLTPFEFQYKGKQPISCLVNVNITADQDTKGDDTVLFGLSQNGTIISQIQTDIKDGADKTFGFNSVLQLVENDLLRFECQNLTTGTDTNGFRATGFNGSLVEI